MDVTIPRLLTIALIGNPNSGKTTLFNRLTGARQKVGNFPGVTVTRKEGMLILEGRTFRVVDLPGIYSLSSRTPEERVTRNYLLNHPPDLVINVLDAGNLERNLYLTAEILDLGLPTLFCLNMADEARERGILAHSALLAERLGGPVVETVGRTGEGLTDLRQTLLSLARHEIMAKPKPFLLHEDLTRAAERVQSLWPQATSWLAVKLLEGEEQGIDRPVPPEARDLAARERESLASGHGEEVSAILARERYAAIVRLLEEVRPQGEMPQRPFTRRLDDLFLHHWLGIPLFLFFLWGMFEATFTLGAPLSNAIDQFFALLSEGVKNLLAPGLFQDVVAGGILPGIGGVLVFLPNIMILFLLISFFEDSGYLARAAFLADRLMQSVGLHGKAFVPLLLGFGCNVPAIMAARTLENPRDRLVTILINPFISCTARLPVFVLLAGSFFPEHASLILFALYLFGLLVALGTALFLKNILLAGPEDPFLLELPPYRLPTPGTVLLHMWGRASEFLRKVGGVILVGSLLVWFLQAFPRGEIPAEPSYLEQLGREMAPAFAPLGVDWKGSVALLSGFVAKEVVVSTLSVLHQTGGDEHSPQLKSALRQSMDTPSAIAFMIFTLLYVPCLSTVAVIRKETASLAWTGFSVLFSLSLAWILAFLAHGVLSAVS